MKIGSIVFPPQVPRETKLLPGNPLARVTEEDIKNLKRLKFFLANTKDIKCARKFLPNLTIDISWQYWSIKKDSWVDSPTWQEAVDAAMKGS